MIFSRQNYNFFPPKFSFFSRQNFHNFPRRCSFFPPRLSFFSRQNFQAHLDELRRKYDHAKKIIHELKRHEQFLAVQLQVPGTNPFKSLFELRYNLDFDISYTIWLKIVPEHVLIKKFVEVRPFRSS
jgi:hypothetical protein